MHKSEPGLDNETHKIFWNFKIQTNHLIPARRPDLLLINKEKWTSRLVDFTFLANYRVKIKESEKIDKNLEI